MKLALKNILKFIKNVLVLLSLYSYTYGCGNNGFEDGESMVAVNQEDETAYREFLAFTKKQTQTEGLHLFFFNVGHGNFILVRDKNNAMIVDAGSDNKNTIKKHDTGSENGTKVKDYIKELFQHCLGAAVLRQIIITHNHKDHKNYVYDGSNNIIWELFTGVQKLWSPEIITKPTKLHSVINKTILSLLQPTNIVELITENDKSSVFTLTYDDIKVLFTGDATGKTLDNYVEKHQGVIGFQKFVVDQNRKLLENVHLLVIPHHGSSTEDSFRWTLYILKHSNNLLASVISADAFVGQYKDIRSWIRDVSWPWTMKNTEIENYIQYWSAGNEKHQKRTQTALFITGAEPCRCVYFKIHDKKLFKYDAKKKDFIHLTGWCWFLGDNGNNYEGYDDVDNTITIEVEENNNEQNFNYFQDLPSEHSSVFNGNLMQKQKEKELSPIKKFSINLQINNPFTNKGSTLNLNNITINNPEQMEEDFDVSAILSQEQE